MVPGLGSIAQRREDPAPKLALELVPSRGLDDQAEVDRQLDLTRQAAARFPTLADAVVVPAGTDPLALAAALRGPQAGGRTAAVLVTPLAAPFAPAA